MKLGNERNSDRLLELHSGMTIEDHTLTWELVDALGDAYGDHRDGEGNWGKCITTRIKDITGIEIIDPRSEVEDHLYNCVHYAFGIVHGNEWARPGTEVPQAVFAPDFSLLGSKGYETVLHPSPQDIAAYSWETSINHFGIYEGGGLVVSKFGEGPIVRHDLTRAIEEGTTRIFFLRKIR